MVPIHASLGLANFWLAIATSVSGIIEKERETAKDPNLRWVPKSYKWNRLIL